jgi:pantoate--beta-alanine ligase
MWRKRAWVAVCAARRGPVISAGVTTVVANYSTWCSPGSRCSGEKDAQQLRIIRRMVRDLAFPVEIVSGPTVREADGLAMSSRNAMLKPDERAQAVCLRKALDEAQRLYRSRGAFRAHARDCHARGDRACPPWPGWITSSWWTTRRWSR